MENRRWRINDQAVKRNMLITSIPAAAVPTAITPSEIMGSIDAAWIVTADLLGFSTPEMGVREKFLGAVVARFQERAQPAAGSGRSMALRRGLACRRESSWMRRCSSSAKSSPNLTSRRLFAITNT